MLQRLPHQTWTSVSPEGQLQPPDRTAVNQFPASPRRRAWVRLFLRFTTSSANQETDRQVTLIQPQTHLFLHPFAAFVSSSEDQRAGKDEENLGGESSRTEQQWKKPAASKPVNCVIERIPRNVRNGSSQGQQQQRESGTEAAIRGQESSTDPRLSGRERTCPDVSTEAQAESAPRPAPADLRSKLAAFRFTANTARGPVWRQDSDVPQQDSLSRRTPAGAGGSASPQVGSYEQRFSSGGRKRKHPSND